VFGHDGRGVGRPASRRLQAGLGRGRLLARCSALGMAAKAGLKCHCRRACSTSTHSLAASRASLWW
jgi:hypothetical protein